PSRRRRAPPVFGLSSAENSVNAPRSIEPFREISLNELAENSLGSVPSKPIFCSTPSMPNFNKRRHPRFPNEATRHEPGSLYQSTTRSTAQTPPGAAASPALPGKTFSTHTPTDMLWNNVIVFIYFFVKVVCEDQDLTDAEKVYAECGQQGPLSWEECILPHRMKRCVKIGEGTFGEVFSTTNAAGEMVVIPLEGSKKVNGEDQKTFGEILPEIIISKELSHLKEKQQNQTHGFIGLNDLHCVQGYYPPEFLKAWDAFDKRKGSENDRPDFFEEDHLFIILEFEFGGVDLENSNGTLASFVVARSILHQVTVALAVAEQELHFEHRDLHWGNVLVKATREKTGTFLLNGEAHSMETKGVLVRIIDYSLSRLEIDDLTVSCDISKDEELFMGQGDYQFEIYRLMRQENGNKWSSYHPRTNVLWLHYLCSKLLSMKYKSSGGRGTKNAREELTRFYDDVLQYSSATDTLQNCPMFR
uniref:Serine/threonine-protein kinase haspin n=1 Tax=Xiphophorus couchianus TaxID=32473 RepID=A0A3B5LMT9_9TELE